MKGRPLALPRGLKKANAVSGLQESGTWEPPME
jgi:hypothetical protein